MDPLEETRRLHEFDPQLLAHHVLRKVKNPLIDEDIKLLKQAIEVLQSKSDVEIHTQDDHVCSKAFRRPAILTTATSLQAYTSLMLRGLEPRDEIYISSETGHWLLTDSVVEALKQTRTIRVLLAFDIDKKDLKEKYGRRVKPLVIEPWRHNRHMTIVCQGNRPVKAIYFARRLRTPVITPVFLDGPRDVQRLMTMYMARWDEAERDGGRGAGRKRPRRTT